MGRREKQWKTYMFMFSHTHIYIYTLYIYYVCIYIHTYILRMGTRLQHQTCSHVNSPYLSIARGSHVLPLWLKYYCRSPRENIRHAEAVSLLSSWLRANHFNTNKEHISERISDSQVISRRSPTEPTSG